MRRLLNLCNSTASSSLVFYPSLFLCVGTLTPATDKEDSSISTVDRILIKRRLLRKKIKKKGDQLWNKVKFYTFEKPSLAERIEGNYDNRIRQHSTPEKIFSTFASKVDKITGRAYMTFSDFRRALLPYDYRPQHLELPFIPPAFLKSLISADIQRTEAEKNGIIHLSEFLFITTLLSIPPSDFEIAFKIFDTDGNGSMSADEFHALMIHFQTPNTSAYDFDIVRKSKMWQSLFGKEQTKELSLSQFSSFLTDLRSAMLIIEYERFNGCITKKTDARNFAMSLVSYAHHSTIPWYIARIYKISESKFKPISFEEFVDFNMSLYYIHEIIHALKFYTVCKDEISREVFCHTVKCVSGITLSENIIDILFWIFDEDDNNTLDYKEIESLMTERFAYGQNNERVLGHVKYYDCFKACFQD